MGMDISSLPRPVSHQAPAPTSQGDSISKAAKEFETVFLSQAVNSMMKDVGGDGMFGGGQAEQQWRSFLGEAYAKAISDSNTTGIAPSVEKMMRAYKGGME
jgi:peptidoglycan hydrolase FlgJ